jgi:hypothetical protein
LGLIRGGKGEDEEKADVEGGKEGEEGEGAPRQAWTEYRS